MPRSNVRNPALYDALANLTIASLKLLPPRPWTDVYVAVPDFTEYEHTGVIQTRPHSVVDVTWLTARVTSTLDQWPEFMQLLEIAKEDPELHVVLLPDVIRYDGPEGEVTAHSWLLGIRLRGFLFDYLWAARTSLPTMDWTVYESLYSNFETSVYESRRRYTVWLPLQSFDLQPPDTVHLDDNVIITEATLDDRARMQMATEGLVDMRRRHQDRFFLCVDKDIPLGRLPDLTDINEVDLWITAIRVIAGGDCHVGPSVVLVRPGDCTPLVNSASIGGVARGGSGLSITNLQADQRERVRYAKDGVVIQEPRFRIAFLRYRQLVERTYPADRLTDAVIGLEHLLLRSEKDELRFKFALRGAWLLGESADSRADWFTRLKRLYDYRSSVVHGSANADKSPQLVAEASDVLRQVLMMVVDRRMSGDDWTTLLQRIVYG